MAAFLWVFLGGGLGSMFRFGIAKIFALLNWVSPGATLTANALSCIVLGFLIALEIKSGLELKYRWFLMAGFCGGFSTFSTFSGEGFEMLHQQQYTSFLLYTVASLVLCLICIIIGYKLA
jgi:CrcB protein